MGEDFSKSVSSPATKKLFEVREDEYKLSLKKGELFYSILEKLLFIMKWSSPDM